MAKVLCETLKSQGYQARLYSLDNFLIYRHETVLASQIDRMFFGSMKIKEAEEEQPEIAIFDRTLVDNIIYSRCFHKFGQLTDTELTNLIRVYQMNDYRKHRLDAITLFLNPSLERMLKNIHERGREKDSILDTDEFIKCLKKMFENHYQYYIDGRILELTDYSEKSIIETLRENDIIQLDYK
jgi:hypothetical protein